MTRDKDVALEVVDELRQAWIEFEAGHDLQGLRMNCCAKSKRLFDALAMFELITRPATRAHKGDA